MSKQIEVTDHAVLRWLERVEGVDCNAIRRRIAIAALVAEKHGARAVRKDGVTFILAYDEEGTAVTTVHTPHPREHLSVPRRLEKDAR